MRFSYTALVLCEFLLGLLLGQAPQAPKPAVSDSTVVATVGGKQYTAAEVREVFNSIPPQYQQSAMANPEAALQQVLMQKYLAEEAKKHGLENESPYKQQLEFFFAQAEINDYHNRLVVPYDVVAKYYKDHPDEFQEAKVRMIQIVYSSGLVKSDKKYRTEEEAKAKAEELHKKLLAGADFAEVAKENSDDKDTAEKGGEWGVIKRDSKLPDDVKNAIFSLRPGQVGGPIKQPNGYYLVKVESISTEPFNDVSNKLTEKLRNERFDAWMHEIQNRFKVKVENDDFFKRKPVAAASH